MASELTTLQAARVAAFAINVVELRRTHGCNITSWGRTKKRNADIGGRPDSFHLEDLAADLVPEDRNQVPAIVADARARGLDAGDEGDHVHVELDYRRHR